MVKDKANYMKGVSVDLCKPSNAIDIYALLQEAQKEGVLEGRPTKKQLESYYFGALMAQLNSPLSRWYLARRGKGYLGFLHIVFVPNKFDQREIEYAYINQFFVVKKRRKLGVGKKLLDEMIKQIDNIGVRVLRLEASKSDQEYFTKKRKAEVVRSTLEFKI